LIDEESNLNKLGFLANRSKMLPIIQKMSSTLFNEWSTKEQKSKRLWVTEMGKQKERSVMCSHIYIYAAVSFFAAKNKHNAIFAPIEPVFFI
jgi:hypothetical protein